MQSTPVTNFTAMKLSLTLLAGCLCFNASIVIRALARPSWNSDFRGPWSFAGFSRHHVARMYQAAPLQSFQHQIYPDFHSFFPFQYPPSFLLPIAWLADFSYPAARIIWTLAGLAVLVASAWIFFAPSQRGFGILALLAAPAALLNGVAGETGYFTAAFLLAGFAWLPARPMLAGLAFGLLTLKPQLGLLIPVALMARGDYRACLTAILVALALIGISCVVFPAGLWLDWLRQMPVDQAEYMAAGASLCRDSDITIVASLLRLGSPASLAWGMQAFAILGSAAAVHVVFRRAPYQLAVAALLTGSLVCAPHAYAYDTIPLTAAMLGVKSARATVLCGVTWLAPYLLITGASHWFIYPIPETLLFLGIIFLALNPAAPPDIAHEPIFAAEHVSRQ